MSVKDITVKNGAKRNYSYVHIWLMRNYGKADHCTNSSCLGLSSRYEWALIKGKEYVLERDNFTQLCKQCHGLYDIGGIPSWNSGIKAKDHPKLRAALDKAHEAVRGTVAWNKQITEVFCDNCGGPTMKRPSDRKHSRTGKLFCSRECMYQSRREHYTGLKLREGKNHGE